ncbi:MAG: hypothetical protein WKF29_04015 [Thermoleophilaceae bacterium]
MSLLTHHAEALLCVANTPAMRLKDIAQCIGITERAAHRIICELEADGYLTRHREGRRNRYEVHSQGPLDPASGADASVGDLLRLLSRFRAQRPIAAA